MIWWSEFYLKLWELLHFAALRSSTFESTADKTLESIKTQKGSHPEPLSVCVEKVELCARNLVNQTYRMVIWFQWESEMPRILPLIGAYFVLCGVVLGDSTSEPSLQPSFPPSLSPTESPTFSPTQPTIEPSQNPSTVPTTTPVPSAAPTFASGWVTYNIKLHVTIRIPCRKHLDFLSTSVWSNTRKIKLSVLFFIRARQVSFFSFSGMCRKMSNHELIPTFSHTDAAIISYFSDSNCSTTSVTNTETFMFNVCNITSSVATGLYSSNVVCSAATTTANTLPAPFNDGSHIIRKWVCFFDIIAWLYSGILFRALVASWCHVLSVIHILFKFCNIRTVLRINILHYFTARTTAWLVAQTAHKAVLKPYNKITVFQIIIYHPRINTNPTNTYTRIKWPFWAQIAKALRCMQYWIRFAVWMMMILSPLTYLVSVMIHPRNNTGTFVYVC